RGVASSRDVLRAAAGGTPSSAPTSAISITTNGLAGPVIGVTFDGTGFGTDGTVWGGEFLVGDYRQFRRAAHLRYVGMPGGEKAIREPWRMAIAHLTDAGVESPPLAARISQPELRTVKKMLERRLHTPLTSRARRLFDCVASLCGLRDRVSYEGQAAVELEWLATTVAPEAAYPFDVCHPSQGDEVEPPLVVDTRPFVRAVAEDRSKEVEAAVI